MAQGLIREAFPYAEKDKFYPAMPFVTVGCFVGLAIIWLGWLL